MFRLIAMVLILLTAVGICFVTGGFAGPGWLWQLPLWMVGSALGWLVVHLSVLLIACAFVDTEKPQEKDSKFYRVLAQSTAQLALWILRMRVHTKGLGMPPKNGRFLLVCNHLSLLDPVMLLAYFRKSQLAFISKRENDSMFVVGKVMHKLMCQLINRENDKEALKTIIACIKMIQQDQVSVAVFPEGYIHGDGLLHPFRSGVFKIAQKTKVPIVVCTIKNTHMVKKNMRKLMHTDVDLHVVGVVQPEEYEGLTTVDVANRVHAMMAEDLGPDLVLQETP